MLVVEETAALELRIYPYVCSRIVHIIPSLRGLRYLT
jgi:hypothetical protein